MILNKKLLINKGFTIVELMITIAVFSIVVGSLWTLFNAQSRQITSNIDTNLNVQEARTISKVLGNDFFYVSFGQDEKLAFYVLDNSQKSNSWSDSLFFADWQFLGGDEIKSSARKNNGVSFLCIGGAADILGGAGSQSINVDCLNLDDYGFGKHKLFIPIYKESDGSNNQSFTNYDNCYGDNCTDNCGNKNGKKCSNNEFVGGVWQTVISNAPFNKVARIKKIINNTLILDRPLDGSKVAPAIYYCLDEGSNQDCDSNPATVFIFKRSDRTSGGRQPVASNIIDFQVAYQDKFDNWYCDGKGPCPMSPFEPQKIKQVRISIISRNNSSENPSEIKKCIWDSAKSKPACKSEDGSITDATCISIENGRPWGCECKTTSELKSKYFVTTYQIIPWNIVMDDLLNNEL